MQLLTVESHGLVAAADIPSPDEELPISSPSQDYHLRSGEADTKPSINLRPRAIHPGIIA